jgi:hypothetical protein
MLERAIVHDNRDPDKLGRLRVRIPTKTGKAVTGWCWPVVPCGYLVLPKPGEQVWITYESGDTDFPVWLGKISTTGTYREGNTDLGSPKDLLFRLKSAEAAIQALQVAVAALQSGKANVGHSH